MALFAYLMHTEAAPRDAERVSELRAAFDHELFIWEKRAEGHPPGAIELSALTVFAYVATAARLGMTLDKTPALKQVVYDIAERPAVQRAWPSTWSKSALEGESDVLA